MSDLSVRTLTCLNCGADFKQHYQNLLPDSWHMPSVCLDCEKPHLVERYEDGWKLMEQCRNNSRAERGFQVWRWYLTPNGEVKRERPIN